MLFFHHTALPPAAELQVSEAGPPGAPLPRLHKAYKVSPCKLLLSILSRTGQGQVTHLAQVPSTGSGIEQVCVFTNLSGDPPVLEMLVFRVIKKWFLSSKFCLNVVLL